ncbi:hypothetical protein SAMN02799622_04003 [Methylobacterium sp. UNC378MF]|uniref:DUF6894 family protein n=1 Tax=unclassified Methylobacterium TaxID=2615210 RepID=UPI000882040E|nr:MULTISPECIES: hypothetical protein [unclassified Methylobacterium]KAA0122403.1 hypothetical protein CIW48_17950 [Methylobacterium sp. P1-11]SDA27392.1 hypothetical protein SAMN02799622_04003 [Methylobacterium sp. UNC378MF]
MPSRFYFDIENGKETIRDAQGVEAEDLAEALAEARSVIDEMAGEPGAAGLSGAWTLVVRDATGAVVGRLPIKG